MPYRTDILSTAENDESDDYKITWSYVEEAK